MGVEEYKKLIIEMLDQIADEKALRRIYLIIVAIVKG